MSARSSIHSDRPSPRLSAAFSRGVRLFFVVACALLVLLASPRVALAVSTHDLMELSRAGLGDEVLIALIEADGTVFNLDGPKILELRAAGVSERVITAMLRNATRATPGAPRGANPAPSTAAPATVPLEQFGPPYFVVIGDKPADQPAPAAPVYVMPWIPWVGASARAARHPQPTIEYRGFGRFINDGWIDNTRPGRFMNDGWVDRSHR